MGHTWTHSEKTIKFDTASGLMEEKNWAIVNYRVCYVLNGKEFKTNSFNSSGYTKVNVIGEMYVNFFTNDANEMELDEITQQEYKALETSDAPNKK